MTAETLNAVFSSIRSHVYAQRSITTSIERQVMHDIRTYVLWGDMLRYLPRPDLGFGHLAVNHLIGVSYGLQDVHLVRFLRKLLENPSEFSEALHLIDTRVHAQDNHRRPYCLVSRWRECSNWWWSQRPPAVRSALP